MVTRRVVIAVAAAAPVALFAFAIAYAASAGHLDGSFGHHGIAVVRKIDRPAGDAAVGGHNRVVAVAGRGAFKITRTLPNGDVEKGFGHRGVVTVRFGSNEAIPESVVIEREGGIVVAGRVCSSAHGCHVGVARLGPNGHLDRHFGGDGKVEIHFPTPYVLETWVALGAGGRIDVAAGVTDSRSSDDLHIALSALRSDGSLDPRFGTGGKVVSSFAPAGDQCLEAYGQMEGMELDSSDRIVVTGTGCLPGTRISVARFKRNGELDPSFSGDGRVNRKFGVFTVDALAIDKGDRIDVMGDLRRQTFAIVRLRSDGGLDRSFGKEGRARGKWGKSSDLGRAGVSSGAVDSRGRIIIAGTHSGGLAFARFTPDGHQDRRFGHRGKVVVKDPKRDFHLGWLSAVAVDNRDRIIGAGREKRGEHRSGSSHLALVRLLG
jgi:uncharacterized delta-60 repeat protein